MIYSCCPVQSCNEADIPSSFVAISPSRKRRVFYSDALPAPTIAGHAGTDSEDEWGTSNLSVLMDVLGFLIP